LAGSGHRRPDLTSPGRTHIINYEGKKEKTLKGFSSLLENYS
jgi:hypothetical protein